MVKCNRIDNKPCKCELGDPQVAIVLQTIVQSIFKLLLGTISSEDVRRLRAAVRSPNTRRYIILYLEQIERDGLGL